MRPASRSVLTLRPVSGLEARGAYTRLRPRSPTPASTRARTRPSWRANGCSAVPTTCQLSGALPPRGGEPARRYRQWVGERDDIRFGRSRTRPAGGAAVVRHPRPERRLHRAAPPGRARRVSISPPGSRTCSTRSYEQAANYRARGRTSSSGSPRVRWRIASLLPGATEIALALGLRESPGGREPLVRFPGPRRPAAEGDPHPHPERGAPAARSTRIVREASARGESLYEVDAGVPRRARARPDSHPGDLSGLRGRPRAR